MANRFLLAMIASFAVLILYSNLVRQDDPKAPENAGEQSESTDDQKEDTGNTNGAPSTSRPASSGSPKSAKGAETTDSVLDAAEYKGELTLATEKLHFVFDQKGAALRSAFILDQYATPEDKKSKNETVGGHYEFVRTYEGGERAFELYDRSATGAEEGWANKQRWATNGRSADGKSIAFHIDATRGGKRFRITKTFSLNGTDRRLNVKLRLESLDGRDISRSFWMNTSGGLFPYRRAYLEPNDPGRYGVVMYESRDGSSEIVDEPISDILGQDENSRVTGVGRFACDMGIYFGAYLWAENPNSVADVRVKAIDPIEELNLQSPTMEDLKRYGPKRIWSQLGVVLATGGTSPPESSFQYYVGPKDHRVIREEFAKDSSQQESYLAVADRSLTGQSIGCCTAGPLGWLIQTIAKALIWLLSFFKGLVGSMGIAIILLTIFIKILMFPMTRKSQVSMAKHGKQMAKIKPKMDALKEKHKNDPQKMQQEIMALYKENNMKMLPLGGCLPALLNMPVFFGLFSALRFDYLLRHESFLWCHDLAMPDRFIPMEPFALPCCAGMGVSISGLHIFPILMIAAMFFHQLGMPKSEDPQMRQQQKMMMFMPLMFGVFMYGYAAGLSVYWLSNSLFGIFEQRVIKKLFPIDKEEDAAQKDVKKS